MIPGTRCDHFGPSTPFDRRAEHQLDSLVEEQFAAVDPGSLEFTLITGSNPRGGYQTVAAQPLVR